MRTGHVHAETMFEITMVEHRQPPLPICCPEEGWLMLFRRSVFFVTFKTVSETCKGENHDGL
jgi:hypothetical protein